MKSGKRKRYDGRFKEKVALEAVKGERITAKLSRTRGIHLKCPAEPVENASRFPTASTESVDDTYLYRQTFQDTTFHVPGLVSSPGDPCTSKPLVHKMWQREQGF